MWIAIDKLIDPSIDIQANLKKIDALVSQIRMMLADKKNPTDGEKMDAIRRYLYDAGPWNNYQAFQYDLDRPEGTYVPEKLISVYSLAASSKSVSNIVFSPR